MNKQYKSWDYCPYCSGDLDTGWECTSCKADLMSYAYPWWQRFSDRLRGLFK